MANRDEQLQNVVNEKSEDVFMRSKADIWNYYLDKHNGDKRAAASDAARDLSGESSGKGYRSARRNFEGSRATAITRGETAKWREFGKELPSIGKHAIGDSITVTVKGTQKMGKSGTRDRTITVTFTGANAQGFIDNPSFRSIWDEYGVDPDLFEDGDYALDVQAVA